MNSRVIVAAIIRKDNYFLFGRKEKDIGPYPNTWHLIGGGAHLEKETLEEAGIEIKDIKRFSFDEGDEPNKHGELTHYIFLVYDVNYKSGQIIPGDDIVELRWVNKDEVKNLPLPAPTQKVFSLLNLV